MGHVPAILRARTASAVERVLRRACAKPALAFAPTHLLVGHSFRAGRAFDLIGDWHLRSDGGDATIVQASQGQASNFHVPAMRVVKGSTKSWVGESDDAYNPSSYFALLMITRYLNEGGGGYYIGTLKGPAIGDPYPLNGPEWPGPQYGADIGWGISANAGVAEDSGGFGFGLYGDGEEPGRFDMNTDASDADIGDGVWRPMIFLYHDTSPHGRIRSSTPTGYTADEILQPIGDIRSPDSRFRFGALDFFGHVTNTATIEIAMMAWFEGDAVENFWFHNEQIALMLQEDLDA